MQENNRARDFVIAEVLACVTFVLNTICVVTGKIKHGPTAPVWEPDFGLIYWLKTILAVVGIVYFFRSRKYPASLIIKFFTIVLLLFSLPVINFILTFYPSLIFSGNIMLRGTNFDVNYASMRAFNARIPTQATWSIPVFIIMIDLLVRFIKKKIT
jgi:CBS domain containing-hemolysin-like protein